MLSFEFFTWQIIDVVDVAVADDVKGKNWLRMARWVIMTRWVVDHVTHKILSSLEMWFIGCMHNITKHLSGKSRFQSS